jgi:hypothetical protein
MFICVAYFITASAANLRPLASLYAQRQSINVQRIQTLRGAVAAEEIPDFTGKFDTGLVLCDAIFSIVLPCYYRNEKV